MELIEALTQNIQPSMSNSNLSDVYSSFAPSAHRSELATALIDMCRNCERGESERLAYPKLEHDLYSQMFLSTALAVKARDDRAYAAWGSAQLQVRCDSIATAFSFYF